MCFLDDCCDSLIIFNHVPYVSSVVSHLIQSIGLNFFCADIETSFHGVAGSSVSIYITSDSRNS